MKPVWFLPRTRDQPPLEAMALGNIIASPCDPEESLNDDPPPLVPTESMRRSEVTDWKWTREFQTSRGGGVFTSFLQSLGIGGDVDITTDSSRAEVYDVEQMVTLEFTPSKAYLEQAIQDSGVQIALARKKKVYMITGLKLAYGATKALQRMNKRGIHAQIGIDTSVLGAPVTVGPKGHVTSAITETLSSGRSDFVFGFRVRLLANEKGQVATKKHDRGAKYGLGRRANDVGAIGEGLKVSDCTFEDIEGVSAGDFMMQSKDVVAVESGEEQVHYFILS
jgi:hypothetical protein